MAGDIPVVGPIINKIFGTRNERFVKRYGARVDAIDRLGPGLLGKSDEELRGMIAALRERAEAKQGDVDVMIEAFAGRRWRDWYALALAEGYRFLSFGDAMFLQREQPR